jgi:flagellar biosynthesis/type III secretory pathway M-ring protein FliF/YscJ
LRKEKPKHGFGYCEKYIMLQKIIEWFNNLRIEWQTVIFGAGVAVIVGLFALLKWLFRKKLRRIILG